MSRAATTILRELLIDAAIERMHDVDAEAKHTEAEAALAAVIELIEAAKDLHVAYRALVTATPGASIAGLGLGIDRLARALPGLEVQS